MSVFGLPTQRDRWKNLRTVVMLRAERRLGAKRSIALNLLKQETSAKVGIKAKRLKAAWDREYLLKVLSI